MTESERITRSERETGDAGRELGSRLKAGDVVCLHGDLGAGKTVFARGIAAGLGIEGPVTSPSFTLVNTYEGRVTLHHFDAWRVVDEEELLDIGFDEYLDGSAVVLIEWAERIAGLLPESVSHVRIERMEAADAMESTEPHVEQMRRIRMERGPA